MFSSHVYCVSVYFKSTLFYLIVLSHLERNVIVKYTDTPFMCILAFSFSHDCNILLLNSFIHFSKF